MEYAAPVIAPSGPPRFLKSQRATRLCKRCQTTKPIDAYTPYHGGKRRRVCDDCFAIIEAETTHKHCARCEIEKPLTEFYKSAASKDGYNTLCQRCHNGWEPEPKPPTLLETTIKACEQCHVEKPLAEFAQRLKICKACASINYHAKVAAVYPPDSAKACIVCKEVKLIDEFPKGSATFGRASKCKTCSAAYTKQYELDNPEKVKRKGQRQHREMKASPEKRAANNARVRALRFKDHRKYMFKGALERHKLTGVPFEITEDDIPDMPQICEASHVAASVVLCRWAQNRQLAFARQDRQ
jgi:hypothetical protein